MKKNSFVEGTFIATFAIILIKILGALYVIPFYRIIGEDGGALYSYAYNVYNLFLNISTAGLPVAISKIISEYNALEMYETKERAYKICRNVMTIISCIAFFLVFVFAEEFAVLIIGNIEGGNSIQDIGFCIRSVSFCLLIIPFLSATKGYLQGHKFIAPSSTSQIIEQIVRIAIILMGSYITINILHKSVSTGVAIAISGAFFGGLAAYIYLKIKIKKNEKLFIKTKGKEEPKIKDKEIIKKIITYAIPLIIVSIAIDIYSLTDMSLIIRGLYFLGYSAEESEIISSIIATWGTKICMIINSVSIGLGVSLIPHMVSYYVKNNIKELNKKFIQAIGIIIVTALPMAVGLSILSEPVYTLFYGASEYGGAILKFLVYSAFAASLHMTINMTLQSLNKFKIVYLNTILGFVTNAVLDIPLMILFHNIGIPAYYGAIAATLTGYSLSFFLALSSLKRELTFTYKPIVNILKKEALSIISMLIVLLILNQIMPIRSDSTLNIIIVCGTYAIPGAITYIIVAYKTKLLYDVFGENYVNNIKNKIIRKHV